MPNYVVKVVTPNGSHLPPVVANFPDEVGAIKAVKLMVGDESTVTARPLRDDVMSAAFGLVLEGSATFRVDWIWRGENDDTPEPY